MDQEENGQGRAEASQHVAQDPIRVEQPPRDVPQVIDAVLYQPQPQVCCRCHRYLPLGIIICGHLFCWPCVNAQPIIQYRLARGA